MEEATPRVASTSSISAPPPADSAAPPMTKTALKRAAKKQAQLDARPARRALEKSKKKAKKVEKRKLAELDEGGEGEGGEAEREAKRLKKGGAESKRAKEGDARVVIDLGFDEKMVEKVSFSYIGTKRTA